MIASARAMREAELVSHDEHRSHVSRERRAPLRHSCVASRKNLKVGSGFLFFTTTVSEKPRLRRHLFCGKEFGILPWLW